MELVHLPGSDNEYRLKVGATVWIELENQKWVIYISDQNRDTRIDVYEKGKELGSPFFSVDIPYESEKTEDELEMEDCAND